MESMNSFWAGFEKKALQDTRTKELAATAVSSLVPFGTTLHTGFKDPKGKDRGTEFLSRILLGKIGAGAGKIIGEGVGAIFGGASSDVEAGLLLGGALGRVIGEMGANTLVHGKKYDKNGKLKAQYKSKD